MEFVVLKNHLSGILSVKNHAFVLLPYIPPVCDWWFLTGNKMECTKYDANYWNTTYKANYWRIESNDFEGKEGLRTKINEMVTHSRGCDICDKIRVKIDTSQINL